MRRAFLPLLIGAAIVWACSGESGGGSAIGETECSDSVDNDNDGKTDCDDPDCALSCIGTGGTAGDGSAGTGGGGTGGTVVGGTGGGGTGGGGTGGGGTGGGGTGGGGTGGTGGTGTGGTGGVPQACDCNDGLSCTDDVCTSTNACSNLVRADYCVIDGVCRAAGQHNGSQCEVCNPAVSQTAWTPIVGGCTTSSYCYAKGEKSTNNCTVCDPTQSSTTLVPSKNDCTIGGKCYEAGEKDPTGCNFCDPNQSTTSWSVVLSDCQIDGKCYKNGAKHPTSSCTDVVCDSTVSKTGWTVKGNECLIGETCKQPGDRTLDRCSACIPSQSKTAWSPANYDCKVGSICYMNGDKHPSSTCTNVVCDKTVSGAAWTVKGNECLIGSACIAAGTQTSDGCTECIPSQSKTAYSPAPFDCKIGSVCYKNNDKHPSPTCTSVVCDATSSTTAWSVKGSECLIGSTCRQQGDKNANGCELCDPTKSTTAWSPAAYDCKIGTVCYSNNDKHPSSTCTSVVCDGTANATGWTVKGSECLIGSSCQQSGAKSSTKCDVCDPTQSTTAWSPAAYDCKIGNLCYLNGEKHPSAACSTILECDGTLSSTDWSIKGNGCYIGSQCYQPNATSPIGCENCNPTVSKTTWTPIGQCVKIQLAALNESHTGNLGGISGADALCAAQAQAAGQTGTWKAFLSTSTQNVKDLITGTPASYPVVNLAGLLMYSSWNALFTTSTWPSSAGYLRTFNGKWVDEGQATPASPDWYDARGWHGSTTSGLVSTSYTCSDWTTTTGNGRNGEWDMYNLLQQYSNTCSTYLAVACVQMPQ